MFVYFRFERVIGWLSGSCGCCFGAKWGNTCPHHFMLSPCLHSATISSEFLISRYSVTDYSFIMKGVKEGNRAYYLYIIYILYI